MARFFAVFIITTSVLCVARSSALLLPLEEETHRHANLDASAVDWTYGGEARHGVLETPAKGWPACSPNAKQYAGYFNISAATNKNYWYWMFESQSNPSTDPVILWLTGGPGCSSALAVLAENGPCHINEKTGKLYLNPHSWNKVATVIYMDQPAGVGFSFADKAGYDSNETEVADDMYRFMQAWYKQFPQFKANKLFVYGESYGGHFAPATAHRIWQGNKKGDAATMPLAGLSVGNGLTAPQIQYKWYSHLAYEWCKTVKGVPCVNETTFQSMKAAEPKCIKMIDDCNANNTECAAANNFCNDKILGQFPSSLNVYDVRIPCEVPGLCYNFTATTDFMNRADVQKALGAVPTKWQMCSDKVNGMFVRDWMHSVNQFVPDLLHDDIRVLIYAGDVDYICNWLGNKAWTVALPWHQHEDFRGTKDLPWYLNDEPAGWFRTVPSKKAGSDVKMLFTFMTIHSAGHMVPMNQPERALEMVKRFLSDEPFVGYWEY